MELKKVLSDFYLTIPDLKYAFICLEGGFIASKILKNKSLHNKDLDNVSAMSYSVFQTANRCSWLLKKMNTESILIDCHNSFQFISGLGKAIFSSEIGKARQKLGLLRLILPQFLKKINILIKKATELQCYNILDVKKLQGDLVIK
jgi:predicted regulator of Ras-like GTPase activity (Roadblock/LC7/MglB family)